MTPETVLFAIRALLRVGTAARDAYEQKVRDSSFPMPNVKLPDFDDKRKLFLFFTEKNNRKFIEEKGPLKEAWDYSMGGLGYPRDDPESIRRLTEARFSIIEAQRSQQGAESDFRKQRLSEDEGIYILLSQWAEGHGPPHPLVRIALSMADVVLEYIGSNPQMMGIGGNAEKFIAGLTGNLRDLLPNPDIVADWKAGEWSKYYFAERAITIFLHAGLKALAEHPDLIVEEKHYKDLVHNILTPLVGAFSDDPATRPSWIELRDTFLGPMAGAALSTLAQHQTAFLGKHFETNQCVGAVTQALLQEIAKGDIRDIFETQGLGKLYQAALNVAVERPELFLRDGEKQGVVLAQKVLSSVAEKFRDAPPPFTKGLAAEVAAAAIETVSKYGPSLFLDPADPWEELAGKTAGSILEGISLGLKKGGVDQALDRILSKEQAVSLVKIFLDQASKTPGMLTGDDAREEIKKIAAAITSTMSEQGAMLLSSENWLAVAEVVAKEAARNPGRLFNLAEDDPTQQLASQVIHLMLSSAAESFSEQRKGGKTILFGETLFQAIEYTLHEVAEHSELALNNTEAINKLVRRLNLLVKNQPNQLGSRQWLKLFSLLLSKAMEGKDFSGVKDEELLSSLTK